MEEEVKEERVVKVEGGQKKCPFCGSAEIGPSKKTGKLICLYCRNEFDDIKKDKKVKNIKELSGNVIGDGAKDIDESQHIFTFKCQSCGAEVVVDTAVSTQARCHWCRNTLSINDTVPNGAVPDALLPFKITKKEAEESIQKFVNKRKFFAHPKFRREFTTENIMGVYFPYMLVDVNAKCHFEGDGEIETNEYTVENGDNKTTYYDADLYHIKRDFDITINELSVESSKDKLNSSIKNKTNNVINSIMPFDTENLVKYDSNYLRDYTAEKRDINVEELKPLVEVQSKDIARYSCNKTLSEYDRGVRFDEEKLDIKGIQWTSAYLPVWLYSYKQDVKDDYILHYVAVNARTKETMGSVPIHMPKLLFISFLIELLGVLGVIFLDGGLRYLLLLIGFIYFGIIYGKYRNSGARHHYERETKNDMDNIVLSDDLVKHKTRLTSSWMDGANNKRVDGAFNKGALEKMKERIPDETIK